jgi:hypothetical protein
MEFYGAKKRSWRRASKRDVMSTAATSSQSILQELQTFYQSRHTDLQQLGSALKNGDLSGAQQAFQSLAVLGEDGPFANSEPFSKSSKAKAFNVVREAIAAGKPNLSAGRVCDTNRRAKYILESCECGSGHSQFLKHGVGECGSGRQPVVDLSAIANLP